MVQVTILTVEGPIYFLIPKNKGLTHGIPYRWPGDFMPPDCSAQSKEWCSRSQNQWLRDRSPPQNTAPKNCRHQIHWMLIEIQNQRHGDCTPPDLKSSDYRLPAQRIIYEIQKLWPETRPTDCRHTACRTPTWRVLHKIQHQRNRHCSSLDCRTSDR